MQNIQIPVYDSHAQHVMYLLHIFLHHPDTDTLSRVQKFKCTKGILKLFGQGLLFKKITSFNFAKIIRQCSSAAFHHQMALVMHACEKLLSGG